MTKPYFRDSEQLYNDIKSLVRYPHDGFFVRRLFEILEMNAEEGAIGWIDEIPDDANKKKAFLVSLGIDFADIEELFEEEIDKLQHSAVRQYPRDFVPDIEKHNKFVVVELDGLKPLRNPENWGRIIDCMPQAAIKKVAIGALENAVKLLQSEG